MTDTNQHVERVRVPHDEYRSDPQAAHEKYGSHLEVPLPDGAAIWVTDPRWICGLLAENQKGCLAP